MQRRKEENSAICVHLCSSVVKVIIRIFGRSVVVLLADGKAVSQQHNRRGGLLVASVHGPPSTIYRLPIQKF
jgi:hypothetical protein